MNDLSSVGIIYALLAYTAWGLFPIFWSFLHHVPAFGILSHRIIWSFLFYGLFVCVRFRADAKSLLRDGLKKWRLILAASIFIGVNWLIYVWAVNNGHVLESSLGYFINPLVNVGLGVLFLKEKLSPLQKAALVLAVVGVLILAVGSGAGMPWIALSLAFTFGFYGLCRKKLLLNSFVGSTLETLFLLPCTVFWFGNSSNPPLDTHTISLLIIGGVVTGLPLIWFSEAAQRLPLSVMGFFQYIAPTLQFFCAVYFFKEVFTPVHAYSFGLIWVAVFINILDLRRSLKRSSAQSVRVNNRKV
jgi:chloramphenicol-sensitive protein RarD